MSFCLIQCVLECLEDIHVGSGLVNPKTGDALLSSVGGKHVIPGSSIKGMIRTIVEYKHRHDPPEQYCFILVSGRKPNLRWVGKLQKVLRLHELRKGSCRGGCRICSLFGRASRASKVLFSDAIPVGDFNPKRTVGNFGWRGEVFPRGTIFNFNINTKDIGHTELELLLEGLEGINGDWKHYLGLKKYDHLAKGGNVLLKIECTVERSLEFGFPEKDAVKGD